MFLGNMISPNIRAEYFSLYLYFSVFLLCMCVSNIYTDKIETMTFQAPKISEEETESGAIPTHLQCDSCRAVAFQINKALNKATRNRMRRLSEADIIDTLDLVCNQDFMEYGMKAVDGTNRLSGPGTEADKVQGMIQMGGLIPKRLKDLCEHFLGEIEEMPIYAAFVEDRSDLVDFLCLGHGIHGLCSQQQHKDEL